MKIFMGEEMWQKKNQRNMGLMIGTNGSKSVKVDVASINKQLNQNYKDREIITVTAKSNPS